MDGHAVANAGQGRAPLQSSTSRRLFFTGKTTAALVYQHRNHLDMLRMFENDSIQAFHDKKPRKGSEMRSMGAPVSTKRDDFIMDTNSSSIVSKRSVEKLYYTNQPEYFRYFVRKFQRRSPLINRGYWLRMKAVEKTVLDFLNEPNDKTKVVVNLGCGYDPLPFQLFGVHFQSCKKTVFVDVDYPQLVVKKVQIIQQNQPLADLLPNLQVVRLPNQDQGEGILAKADNYRAIGCDLRDVARLDLIIRKQFDLDTCSVAILFVAEVSVAYMDIQASDRVLKWAASLPDSRFCLLEQHLPDGADHPFAATMLQHFRKLRTPLTAIGTIADMRKRFDTAGWPSAGVAIHPLWDLWSNDEFLTSEERKALNTVEPFDEWEEFALFGSHYFLLLATNGDLDRVHKYGTGHSARRLHTGNSSQESETITMATKLAASKTCSGAQRYRRFAAAAGGSHGPKSRHQNFLTVAHIGGLATSERVKTVDSYQCCLDTRSEHESSSDGHVDPEGLDSAEMAQRLKGDIPAAVMCHTATPLADDGSSILLIGGRASPDRANALCWILQDGHWTETHPLPAGRYRHCAVRVMWLQQGIDEAENHPICKDEAVQLSRRNGVIVFGGKGSDGRTRDDWLLYLEHEGWRPIIVTGTAPSPRFGAAMTVDETGSSGWLTGGMTEDGTVINDLWSWSLQTDSSGITVHCMARQNPSDGFVGRFGAQIAQIGTSTVLVGGIVGKGMLDRNNEIAYLHEDGKPVRVEWEKRPLLVGMSVFAVGYQLLILGGGATCFSFGTCWSSSQSLSLDDSESLPWKVVDAAPFKTSSISPDSSADIQTPQSITPRIIPRKQLKTSEDFASILQANQPVILSDLDIGPCTTLWTPSYLLNAIGPSRPVTIHDSPTPSMSFSNKNFTYRTLPFSTFVSLATGSRNKPPSHVYLRSLSSDSPTTTPANLATDFPQLAGDFHLPPQLSAHVSPTTTHSSPLRISSPTVRVWLHYDVHPNLLCQIRGAKQLLLYPPARVTDLLVPPGASSSPIDPFATDAADRPSQEHRAALRACGAPFLARLRPGDVLFVPALWWHAARPDVGEEEEEEEEEEEGKLSVAVNVFFRDPRLREGAYAAGRDVYANRDLGAYERGRRDVARMIKGFDGLPSDVRAFYLERLAGEIRDAI